MSRQLALDTIHLRPTERFGHTEYSLGYHHDYVNRITAQENAGETWLERERRLNELWGIDFLWGTNDGLFQDWGNRGRATDMGHAVYAADGSDLRQPQECPFKTVEDVWAFDAVAEYGLPDFDEQVAAYEQFLQNSRTNFPDQFQTGGYYKSMVSGAIAAFGWDMLLLACADRQKMEPVFDSFFRYTQHHMNAWAQTSAEVIIQHDDYVWTAGAFMHPDIYRSVLIPRFAELWKPLKAAGKTVLFISDGNFCEFAHDMQAAGAEGFIFEPDMEFGWMVENFGDSMCLIGSAVDCRDMAFRPWETVKASMDRTAELGRKCRGLIWAVGNHMPANIPDEMMDQYITYLKTIWMR
jgi:hypothetical protein